MAFPQHNPLKQKKTSISYGQNRLGMASDNRISLLPSEEQFAQQLV